MPVLLQNIIETANVAVEMLLIFIYFSLLSKRKMNKLSFLLSYLLPTTTLSIVILLSDNIFLYLVSTIILLALISFFCFDDTIKQ